MNLRANRKTKMENSKTLYKFCSLSTKRKRLHVSNIVMQRQLYFSDPRYFNDPYDCKIAEYLDKYLYPYGVLCFSGVNCDITLMFAHYADCHRGLCLQFGIDENYNLSESPAPFVGEEVKYLKNRPNLPDNPNNAHHSYLIKYKSWSYENEYRVVYPLKKLPFSRLIEYSYGNLHSVIFGFRMSPKDEAMVKSWIQESGHSIFFKKAHVSPDSFNLNFLDV